MLRNYKKILHLPTNFDQKMRIFRQKLGIFHTKMYNFTLKITACLQKKL